MAISSAFQAAADGMARPVDAMSASSSARTRGWRNRVPRPGSVHCHALTAMRHALLEHAVHARHDMEADVVDRNGRRRRRASAVTRRRPRTVSETGDDMAPRRWSRGADQGYRRDGDVVASHSIAWIPPRRASERRRGRLPFRIGRNDKCFTASYTKMSLSPIRRRSPAAQFAILHVL